MPAAPMPSGRDAVAFRVLPLRQARVQLSQLVALARATDTVTLLTEDGDPRPVAAIVPAAAARTGAQVRAEAERAVAGAAGWARRLDQLRIDLASRHHADVRAVTMALAQAWAELDRLRPPGTDRHLDELRQAHACLTSAVADPTDAPIGGVGWTRMPRGLS